MRLCCSQAFEREILSRVPGDIVTFVLSTTNTHVFTLKLRLPTPKRTRARALSTAAARR
jgi:hypothetical protein